jgi:hypothetical protein
MLGVWGFRSKKDTAFALSSQDLLYILLYKELKCKWKHKEQKKLARWRVWIKDSQEDGL